MEVWKKFYSKYSDNDLKRIAEYEGVEPTVDALATKIFNQPKEYIWQDMCKNFERTPLDHLQQVARYENIRFSATTPKKELCHLLSDNLVDKIEEALWYKYETIPKCTNPATLITQEPVGAVPERLFVDWDEGQFKWCENVNDMSTWMLEKRTNPYNRSPLTLRDYNKIFKKFAYFDKTMKKKIAKTSIDVAISRTFGDVNPSLLKNASWSLVRSFAQRLDLQNDLVGFDNLNEVKLHLCLILQRRQLRLTVEADMLRLKRSLASVYTSILTAPRPIALDQPNLVDLFSDNRGRLAQLRQRQLELYRLLEEENVDLGEVLRLERELAADLADLALRLEHEAWNLH